MKKKIKLGVIILIIIFFLYFLSNLFFGWFAHEPWKYRRCTFGDKNLALKRKVFVKELVYKSNFNLAYFNIYIEYGHKFGIFSSNDINIIDHSDYYPYQVSLNNMDTINNVIYEVVNYDQFDYVNNNVLDVSLYLHEPLLKDTLLLKIIKFDKSRDSVGYIKIWDMDVIKK